VPDISVIMATARRDYPIIGLPDMHLFEPTIRSLVRQTFKDFELIIVDALYGKRERQDFSKLPFPVKYVPPHPSHGFWVDRGLWGVAGMLNTALLYAEGELVVRIDDCSEFKEWFLERIWEAYQSGYFPLAMHIRYHAGKPARVNEEYLRSGYEARYAISMDTEDRVTLLRRIYGENGIVRDTRWPVVEKAGKMIAPPEWFYGYSSFTLEAALKINGFNELFDGVKGQEDQDFGIRLDMAGYRNVLLLDKDLWVIEHEHYPCEVKSPPPFKCNYGIIQYERAKGLWRANSWRLSLDDCEWIRCNICPRCFNYRRCLGERLGGRFYIDNDLFRLWLTNQRTFDLREERMDVL